MATEEIYIKGKLKWAMIHQPDKFGNWKVTVYPDEESLAKIQQLQSKGLKNVLGKDEDGYHMTFRRPANKKIRGELRAFAPPNIMDKSGQLITDLIGNGSDGIVKLEIYGFKPPIGNPAIAARLLAIRVDNLVPYSKESFGKDLTNTMSGLAEQKPMF